MPPIPPLPAAAVTLSPQPGGRAPRGTVPPLRQGRRWISCPRRGCLLARGRGHSFAVFNSPRLGSVPRGPPGCVAIVTAWEPQHPGQTGTRLPAHGSLAWGWRRVRLGWGTGWHVCASTHNPVSMWGLGKSHPVGELCTRWVLRTLPGVSPVAPGRAGERVLLLFSERGAQSVMVGSQSFVLGQCVTRPQGHGGPSQPSRGFLQPLLTQSPLRGPCLLQGSSRADWSQVSPRWRRGGSRAPQAEGFRCQPWGLKSHVSSRDG